MKPLASKSEESRVKAAEARDVRFQISDLTKWDAHLILKHYFQEFVLFCCLKTCINPISSLILYPNTSYY